MNFTKMHGAGNDYVYVNCFAEDLPEKERPPLARIVSDRNFGVGSDGLICICPSESCDFKMDMYNADGSRGEMCGNGIRCVGKYVFERGLTSKTVLKIETAAGVKTLWLSIESGVVKTVRVDIGSPSFIPADVPVITKLSEFIRQPVEVRNRLWEVTALSVGNPHAVIFVDRDVDDLSLSEIGPEFENNCIFPERVNTEFVNVLEDGCLKMRVWERGSGETLACGTGAAAVLTAANVCGLCGERAKISLRGGELEAEWDKHSNKLYITGTAEFVFDGTLLI